MLVDGEFISATVVITFTKETNENLKVMSSYKKSVGNTL